MSSQLSPAFASALRARLRVAVQHPVRVDAGEAERDEAGARLEPEPRRCSLARRRARPRRRRTIWLEFPAVTTPSGRNAGLSDASFSARRVAPRRLVDGEEHRCACRSDLDRDDLVLEAPVVDRRDRAPVRLERVRVELLAREAPLLREHLGRDPLRHDLPALGRALSDEIAAVRAHRDARHHLDARRDDDVELAGPDRRGGVEVRLHRRAALAVDGRPADGLRPAGDQRRHAADVPALLADLRDAAHLDVLDLGRIEIVARDEAVQHLAASSSPRVPASVPFRRPIGERTASTISASAGHIAEHRLSAWRTTACREASC